MSSSIIGAAAWLAQNLWWHYEYGLDREFLRMRAYPFFREVAAFYESYLIEDETGTLQIVPSESPENRFKGAENVPVSLCVSATMDVQLARDALSYAARSAHILGVDSENAFEIQVALELWRKEQRTVESIGDGVNGFKGSKTVYPDILVGGPKNRIAWYHRNRVSPWRGTLELQGLQPALEIGTDPLLHRTLGGVIRGEGLVNADNKTLKSAQPQKQ